MAEKVKVRALQKGFYAGQRIRAGAEFVVEAGTKAKWFVPVESAKQRKPRVAKPVVEQPTDEGGADLT